MKNLFPTLLGAVILMSFNFSNAQTPIENQIYIWNGTAPGSDGLTIVEEIEDRDPNGGLCHLNRVVEKVTQPSVKHFAPANPNGTAVLICPGGGYAKLAYDKEGYDIAQWFNERDITAFVLKYRLPIDGHDQRAFVPLQDAQRALRYIRANAANYNIDPEAIGVMGGSAGGHLAASLSVHYDWETYSAQDAFDSLSARPTFSVLMYPVISFQDSITHGGSRNNLLGTPFTETLRDSFSTELHIDNMTPPAFLFHSLLDGSVKYQNSVVYANGLEAVGVENSLNLYSNGGHGIGVCEAGQTSFSAWIYDLDAWLVEQDWTTPCLGDTPSITMTLTDSTRLTTSPAATYQWFRNGVLIPDATDSIYVPQSVGLYKVAVSGQRENSDSDCLIFSEEVQVDVVLNIDDLKQSTFNIFPNPTSSQITIEGKNLNSKINYHIYNQLGECVRQSLNISVNHMNPIDTTQLSSGLYYVVIRSGEEVMTGRFVKE